MRRSTRLNSSSPPPPPVRAPPRLGVTIFLNVSKLYPKELRPKGPWQPSIHARRAFRTCAFCGTSNGQVGSASRISGVRSACADKNSWLTPMACVTWPRVALDCPIPFSRMSQQRWQRPLNFAQTLLVEPLFALERHVFSFSAGRKIRVYVFVPLSSNWSDSDTTLMGIAFARHLWRFLVTCR
jgi:hypothetical protein